MTELKGNVTVCQKYEPEEDPKNGTHHSIAKARSAEFLFNPNCQPLHSSLLFVPHAFATRLTPQPRSQPTPSQDPHTP